MKVDDPGLLRPGDLLFVEHSCFFLVVLKTDIREGVVQTIAGPSDMEIQEGRVGVQVMYLSWRYVRSSTKFVARR